MTLQVAGELDLASSPRLQATAADLISIHLRALTVDLSDLSFADLSGLRALVAVGDEVLKGGAEFRLVGVNEYLLRIIRVVELGVLERACRTTTA